MKKLMLLAVLTGMVLVQGCGGGCWTKPNLTIEEYNKDCAECKYDATKSSYTPMGRFDSPIMAGMQEGLQFNKLFKMCMEARGYRLTNVGCE